MFVIYIHCAELDRTSVGAFPVVAGARRLAATFCLASRGRHPQSAEAGMIGESLFNL